MVVSLVRSFYLAFFFIKLCCDLVIKITIFLYPILAVWLERHYYDAHDPSESSKRSWLRPWRSNAPTTTHDETQGQGQSVSDPHIDSPAIVVSHLAKSFRTSYFPSFKRKNSELDPDTVTAIADLSFVVPRGGIFVLLGSNGAGKSTALGVLAGLIGRSGGSVTFPSVYAGENMEKDPAPGTERVWDGPSRPPKGALGIVPQKNVLFPELTCFQTMKLWSAVKRPVSDGKSEAARVHVEQTPEELERLLVDCGLEGKVHSNAGSLSGGQKRKLQLAIGLVGGSESKCLLFCGGVELLKSRRGISCSCRRVHIWC